MINIIYLQQRPKMSKLVKYFCILFAPPESYTSQQAQEQILRCLQLTEAVSEVNMQKRNVNKHFHKCPPSRDQGCSEVKQLVNNYTCIMYYWWFITIMLLTQAYRRRVVEYSSSRVINYWYGPALGTLVCLCTSHLYRLVAAAAAVLLLLCDSVDRVRLLRLAATTYYTISTVTWTPVYSQA